MYLSESAVLKSISILHSNVHPFVGITFLACKKHRLPIGSTEIISLDQATKKHLDNHHRIDRRSKHYFQPFKGPGFWVAAKYPSSGLQTVNTQTFKTVFLHPKNTRTWGFRDDYLEEISRILNEAHLPATIPADALAVWIYKFQHLKEIKTIDDLVDKFFFDFNILKTEANALFPGRSLASFDADLFTTSPPKMTALLKELPPAPDAESEGGKTISALSLINIGPSLKMELNFGQRLTIITGDNGLGKSFLLDFSWWAATGNWAEKEVTPLEPNNNPQPKITYSIATIDDRIANHSAVFDATTCSWKRDKKSIVVEALAVFSRADGSFSVSDPTRAQFNKATNVTDFLLASEVWNGRHNLIEGLIRDWISWQTSEDKYIFDSFSSVLARLSPEDLGTLTPGKPVRLPGDPRVIPTIQHRYGSVPIIHASAGVRRILLLSYLIIWTWKEHKLASERLSRPPLRRMMVVVDELEAHLHPKWQRIVLPALMTVGDLLSNDLSLQVIAATHSPMILASMEATFSADTDSLFHLHGVGETVLLEELEFIKYGDASGWLTSSLFGLRHARSVEAERAIEVAKSLQTYPESATRDAIQSASRQLQLHLASDDKFWPRWLYFAEQHGVEI